MRPARKKVLLRFEISLVDPCADGVSGQLRQLELHRALCFPLNDHRPCHDLITMNDITHPKVNKVAATELAIDGKIKQRQLSNTLVELQVNSNRPDVFQFQGCLRK